MNSLKKENKYSYGGNWTLAKNKDDVDCLPLPDFIKNKFLSDMKEDGKYGNKVGVIAVA